MPDFVTLTCPTCGGKLQITPDVERFACAHCGNEHLVRRGAGIISLAPVVESMDGLRRATDRTASELAIRRLKEEIAALDGPKAEAEARLAQWNAKLAEHDKWMKDVRSMRLVLGVALLFAAGYVVVEAYIRSGGNVDTDTRWMCAWPLLGIGVFLLLTWIIMLWRLHTVDAIKPPRPQVESTIQGIQAEIRGHETAKLAKQAEIEQLLMAVKPRT
ncbi:MAG: hypothetical protein NTU91_08540 [Chloroflexi bacterium]|nr:hypothetical protein [Chloroflexota bacterium]